MLQYSLVTAAGNFTILHIHTFRRRTDRHMHLRLESADLRQTLGMFHSPPAPPYQLEYGRYMFE